MPRKKIAEQEPVTSMDGAAAAPAPAKKARAPRPSANAVTHKHKKSKSSVIESTTPSPAEDRPAVEQSVVAPVVFAAPTHQEIAEQAYLYWEARGFQGGSPEDDWLRAERELLERRSSL